MLTMIGIIVLAVCLTGIEDGIAEDSEKRYWKRRDEGYRRHKARLKKERIMGENRIELWRRFVK